MGLFHFFFFLSFSVSYNEKLVSLYLHYTLLFTQSPQGDQCPQQTTAPLIPCGCSLTTPSTVASPLHRCRLHAGLQSAHRCCCHHLCLPPGCPPHLVLSPHIPWWLTPPVPAHREPPPRSVFLGRLCTCPLHPPQPQRHRPGHNHPTGGLFTQSVFSTHFWGFRKHSTCPSLCRKTAYPNPSQWGFNFPPQSVQTPSLTCSSNTCPVSLPLPLTAARFAQPHLRAFRLRREGGRENRL